jgi:hypothetical protein
MPACPPPPKSVFRCEFVRIPENRRHSDSRELDLVSWSEGRVGHCDVAYLVVVDSLDMLISSANLDIHHGLLGGVEVACLAGRDDSPHNGTFRDGRGERLSHRDR